MPQASVLTSTAPAPGFGSGSVSTTISPFLKMAARIGVLLVVVGLFKAFPGESQPFTRCWKQEDNIDRDGSGVRGRLGLDWKLRSARPLAMRGVEAARNDERGADHGPDVRHFTEDKEAEDADPQQLAVRKRREHRGAGIPKSQHHDPLPGRRCHPDQESEQDIVPTR